MPDLQLSVFLLRSKPEMRIFRANYLFVGIITVIKSDPTFEAISVNPMSKRMNASPAIRYGKIYLWGYHHFFCIGIE